MLGSNKNILIFNIFAAKHNGKDIYPPVEINIWIFSLFNKYKDLKVKNIIFKIINGNKVDFFSFGVSMTKTFKLLISKYFKPLRSDEIITSYLIFKCS